MSEQIAHFVTQSIHYCDNLLAHKFECTIHEEKNLI